MGIDSEDDAFLLGLLILQHSMEHVPETATHGLTLILGSILERGINMQDGSAGGVPGWNNSHKAH
jgi:hypothetical protein